MHQAFDVHGVQRDEDAETGGRCDDTAVFFAQMLAHVFTFEPGFDVAAGFVGTPLVGAAMQAGGLPRLNIEADFFWLLPRLGHPRGQAFLQPARQLGVRLAGRGQHR